MYHFAAIRFTGVECDISVASGAARFKSTVLRYLADIDSRFSSLVRLVKLWAGAHGMNDAAAGTFNSFALTLMVCIIPFIIVLGGQNLLVHEDTVSMYFGLGLTVAFCGRSLWHILHIAAAMTSSQRP